MNSGKMFLPRPTSLRSVSTEVLSGKDYASAVKEFIDELVNAATAPASHDGFYGIPASFTEEEPEPLPLAVQRAHIGGLAESIASLAGMPAPGWCQRECYFLQVPEHAGGPRSRAAVEAKTPAAFRRRLLFCGPSLENLFRLKPRPIRD